MKLVHTHLIYNSKEVVMRGIDLLEASWKNGNDNVPSDFHRWNFAMQEDNNFNFASFSFIFLLVQSLNAIQPLILPSIITFYFLFYFWNDINTLPIFVLDENSHFFFKKLIVNNENIRNSIVNFQIPSIMNINRLLSLSTNVTDRHR